MELNSSWTAGDDPMFSCHCRTWNLPGALPWYFLEEMLKMLTFSTSRWTARSRLRVKIERTRPAALCAYWLFILRDDNISITVVVLGRLFLPLTSSAPTVVAIKFSKKLTKSAACSICWNCVLLAHHEFSCNLYMHVLFYVSIYVSRQKCTVLNVLK